MVAVGPNHTHVYQRRNIEIPVSRCCGYGFRILIQITRYIYYPPMWVWVLRCFCVGVSMWRPGTEHVLGHICSWDITVLADSVLHNQNVQNNMYDQAEYVEMDFIWRKIRSVLVLKILKLRRQFITSIGFISSSFSC